METNKIKIFQDEVINYYNNYGRKTLPWRQTTNPWKILLSELLLRKTTAKQVIPIYDILEKYTLEQISTIDQSTLENILRPLGIYRQRAKLIIKLATELMNNKYSINEAENIRKFPGVGNYAVNAILCFAFNKPVPALDTNMIRVLKRVFNISINKNRPHMDKYLWKEAQKYVPDGNPKEYNWGVLDISAQFCRPIKPKCINCPLCKICSYNNTVLEDNLS